MTSNNFYGGWGNMGWICPKCGRVYSPVTPMCSYCSGNGGTFSKLDTSPVEPTITTGTPIYRGATSTCSTSTPTGNSKTVLKGNKSCACSDGGKCSGTCGDNCKCKGIEPSISDLLKGIGIDNMEVRAIPVGKSGDTMAFDELLRVLGAKH